MLKSSPPTLNYEQILWNNGLLHIAGVDEVGRGCLSGPVMAAAVILPKNCNIIQQVTDSKKLSAKQREQLFPLIQSQVLDFAIGIASVAEIDQFNILQATYLAMQRALKRLKQVDYILIDGKLTKNQPFGNHITPIIDGDQYCYSIACASIIAKVSRDRLMQRLSKTYQGYGWERNAGYGTAQHKQAIQKQGLTPHHRRSFSTVKAALFLDAEIHTPDTLA
jgi:ribonuclease HII